MSNNQAIEHATLVTGKTGNSNIGRTLLALFNEDGTPFDPSSSGSTGDLQQQIADLTDRVEALETTSMS